jgi:hypothetical protein
MYTVSQSLARGLQRGTDRVSTFSPLFTPYSLNRITYIHRKLNLWADAFWNAGCRTMEEIAADEQAAASPAEHHNPLTQDPLAAHLISPDITRSPKLRCTYIHLCTYEEALCIRTGEFIFFFYKLSLFLLNKFLFAPNYTPGFYCCIDSLAHTTCQILY